MMINFFNNHQLSCFVWFSWTRGRIPYLLSVLGIAPLSLFLYHFVLHQSSFSCSALPHWGVGIISTLQVHGGVLMVMVIKVTGIVIVILSGLYIVVSNCLKTIANPYFIYQIRSQYAKEIFSTYFLNKVGWIIPTIFIGLFNIFLSKGLIAFVSISIVVISLLMILTSPKVLKVLFNMDQTWLQFMCWFKEFLLNTNLYLRCPSLKRRVKVNLTVKDNAERGKVCRDGETDQMFNTSFGNGEKPVIIERKSPMVTPAYGMPHLPSTP